MIPLLIVAGALAGAFALEKRRARLAGETVEGAPATVSSPAAAIVAAIQPAAIPGAGLRLSAGITATLVATVSTIIAERKAGRAAFTQIWPLLTGAEQQVWVGKKFLSLHTTIFNALSRHRRVRQYEQGMTGQSLALTVDEMQEAVAANEGDVSWLISKPGHDGVNQLFRSQSGVGAQHEVAKGADILWTRAGGAIVASPLSGPTQGAT